MIKFRKSWLIPAAIAASLILIAIGLEIVNSSFRRDRLTKQLEEATGASVAVGSFHQVLFPRPGCVAERVSLTRASEKEPYAKADRVTLTGLYSGLFGSEKHLRLLRFDGLRFLVPPTDEPKTDANQRKNLFEGMRFDRIEAHASEIIFLPGKSRSEPLAFEIHDAVLRDYSPTRPVRFESALRLPVPTGEVQISGTFAPAAEGGIANASLDGSYDLKQANLSTFHNLAGVLSSKGSFRGKIEALQVKGTTGVPDFRIEDNRHAINLQTEFSTVVNGTTGDIHFDSVKPSFRKTTLSASGELSSDPQQSGKLVSVKIDSNRAEIEDLLYLFVHENPPIAGPTSFTAKVELPHDDRPFVQRVRMTAHFGINGSRFTKPETEQKVSSLSESARGNPKDEDPPMVVTDLAGDVVLSNGVARFSRLALQVPGASATLHGTFNLQNQKVDLHGLISTDVKLSKATTGFKAFLMKVVEIAKSKKKQGATVPVHVSGTYSKPKFGIDADDEK